MQCPYCRCSETQVVDSRASDEESVIRRRRRCLQCGGRFTTYEKIYFCMPLVVKRHGEKVAYSQEKLEKSMRLALRKRPVADTDIEDAIARIEQAIRLTGEKEITSERIGELVLKELLKLDKVGYMRFASVYFNYDSPADFAEALHKLGFTH